MKKGLKYLLVLTTLLATPLALTGCNETQTSINSEEKEATERALQAITNIPTEATGDFNLITAGLGGCTISWTSSNESIIKIDGTKAKVQRPTTEDTNVTLTAKATLNSTSSEKTFTVLVKKMEVSEVTHKIKQLRDMDVGSSKIDCTIQGTVFVGAKYADEGFWVFDDTGSVYVSKSGAEVETGDIVQVTGQYQLFAGQCSGNYEIAGTVSVKKLSSGSELNLSSAVTVTGADAKKFAKKDDSTVYTTIYKMKAEVVSFVNQQYGRPAYEYKDSTGYVAFYPQSDDAFTLYGPMFGKFTYDKTTKKVTGYEDENHIVDDGKTYDCYFITADFQINDKDGTVKKNRYIPVCVK